jgi:hypothetical protein
LKLKILRSTTSKIVRLFVQDATSITGAGLTGLAYNSSGLTCYYIREGDPSATAVTLSAGTAGTWSSGGFVAVDATNLPGLYELGLPNASLSTGNSTVAMLKGATNQVPSLLEIELDAVNYQDGAAAGLTRLDAAISSRSTYAGADTAGTTTLLTRLPSALSFTGANVNAATQNFPSTVTFSNTSIATVGTVMNPVTASSVTGAVGSVTANVNTNANATETAINTQTTAAQQQANAQAGLTTQGYTTTRAGFLDTLSGLVATIWAYTTRTLSAFGFGVTVTTNNDKTGYSGTATNFTAAPTLASIAASILTNPAYTLTTDSTGKVGTNNLPVEFLSSAEQTALTTSVNDLVSLLGRTDTAPSVSSISTAVSNLLTRLPQTVLFDASGYIKSNSETVSDKTGYSGTATNLPSDYQQRGIAVTLPTLPDVTVGGYASGEDPATLTWAAGTRTLTGKTPAILAASDVTGDLPVNVVLWAGGALPTSFSASNLPTFPTNFATLAIDGSGDVTYNNTSETPPTVIQIRQEIDANSTKLASILADVVAIAAGGALTTGQAAQFAAIAAAVADLGAPGTPTGIARVQDVQITFTQDDLSTTPG